MSTKTLPFFARFSHYLSLIKFSHTIFALPFALIGFTLAIKSPVQSGQPGALLFLYVLLCMVFARSAAMAFNRYLDREFDKLNPRTAKREIPAGIIKPEQALLFTVLSSVGFVATTLLINMLCFYLSFVALFVILFYSYTKRFTALCHLVLGLGLSLAPIGAYIAVTSQFALTPVLFSLVVLTWVSGFDIIYALQDEQFDKSNNLRSIPSALGISRALGVSTFLHVLTLALVIGIGLTGTFYWTYWLGAAVFSGLLTYQHIIVKPNDLSKVNIAFANTNGIASILFATSTIIAALLVR